MRVQSELFLYHFTRERREPAEVHLSLNTPNKRPGCMLGAKSWPLNDGVFIVTRYFHLVTCGRCKRTALYQTWRAEKLGRLAGTVQE